MSSPNAMVAAKSVIDAPVNEPFSLANVGDAMQPYAGTRQGARRLPQARRGFFLLTPLAVARRPGCGSRCAAACRLSRRGDEVLRSAPPPIIAPIKLGGRAGILPSDVFPRRAGPARFNATAYSTLPLARAAPPRSPGSST